MMLAMLAVAAVMVTNQPPTPIVSMTPRERMEWRARRSSEMHTALKWDEAKREARRYEARRRRLNRAAEAFWRLGQPSNAVTRVSVDFRTGDILVEWEDGSKVLRRFDRRPTARKAAHKNKGGK